MDKEIIEQSGTEILCYRIRTARQKKRAVKTAEAKTLLQLHRERKKIRKYQRELGYVKIDPPVVKGWKRYFVLRDDVARSRQALFYQNILDKINTVKYCNRKDFRQKPWYYRKTRKWESIEQTVLQPGHYEFRKLNLTEKEEAMFEERLVKHKWRNEWVKLFVFREQWRFVFRVKQHIITEAKAVDADLESREKEIGDYLERTNKGTKLNRLLGIEANRYKDWDSRPREKYRFKQNHDAAVQVYL